jgi:sugar phosphate isomerase/epimerase
VIDTYHVWWDSQLAGQIADARDRIACFQLADWIEPLPAEPLLGRGHLGDGCIDLAGITAQVLAAGYRGYAEVEIFSREVWDAPADETAATVRRRFGELLRDT